MLVVELVVDDVVVELVDGVDADCAGGPVVDGADGVDVVGATLVVGLVVVVVLVLVVGAGGMSSLSGWVLAGDGTVVGLPALLSLLLSGGSSSLVFGASVVCVAGSALLLAVGESEF